MSIITPKIQSVLNSIRSQPECVSADLILDVPEFLVNQIPPSVDELIMFTCSFSRDNHDSDVDMVVTKQFIENMDFATFNPGELMVKELVFCHHPELLIAGCIHNDFENQGKNTFFMDPVTGVGLRLRSTELPPLDMTPALTKLISLLNAIEGVSKVEAQYIVTDSLKSKVNCPDDQGIIFYLDDDNSYELWRDSKTFGGQYHPDGTSSNYYYFMLPKNVWDNESLFDELIASTTTNWIEHSAQQPK